MKKDNIWQGDFNLKKHPEMVIDGKMCLPSIREKTTVVVTTRKTKKVVLTVRLPKLGTYTETDEDLIGKAIETHYLRLYDKVDIKLKRASIMTFFEVTLDGKAKMVLDWNFYAHYEY